MLVHLETLRNVKFNHSCHNRLLTLPLISALCLLARCGPEK
jgi:hypothetical protein